MNNLNAYEYSKRHDKKLCNVLNKHGISSKISLTVEEDYKGIDIYAANVKIDTKYQLLSRKKLWFEYSKIMSDYYKADEIWCILHGNGKKPNVLCFKRDILKDFLYEQVVNGKIQLIKSIKAKNNQDPNDRICWLNVSDAMKISHTLDQFVKDHKNENN